MSSVILFESKAVTLEFSVERNISPKHISGEIVRLKLRPITFAQQGECTSPSRCNVLHFISTNWLKPLVRTVATKSSLGGFTFVQGGVTLQNMTKTQLNYSVSYLNLGVLELCFWGDKPTQGPVAMGLSLDCHLEIKKKRMNLSFSSATRARKHSVLCNARKPAENGQTTRWLSKLKKWLGKQPNALLISRL